MNKTNKNSPNNSKMAEYYSIFARMLFDIRNDIHFEVEYIEVEYFNREPSHIR